MAADRTFDAPLENPDHDLLGTVPYAQKLAEFIFSVTPPFTIGIYGEWGSGKTSFVNFIRYYLDSNHASSNLPEVVFVRFLAWPHKTADTLWRALLLCVAKELFKTLEKDQTGTAATAEAGSQDGEAKERIGLRRRLVRLLTGEALVLDGPPPAEPDPLASYESLEAFLDRSPVRIGSGGGRQPRLDDEETLAALAGTAVTFLGTLSPLAASLRTLLGLDKVDASKLIRRETNEALRERIGSVDEIRGLFHKLFERTARQGQGESKRCICIFIDDLDRVMPDVALDFLEAIKVFLDEVPSVFLIAADEHLIGQGLRLRFRDLLDATPGDGTTQDLLLRKGKEYFEKIIQLGIRVPPRTPEQAHRFIAAQFPQWLPATDIIRTAIGDNPRRLKQYCNLLRYKYLVEQLEEKAEEELGSPSPLLEKILTIHAWDPECLKLLQNMVRDSATFQATLERIESCLGDSQEDNPVADARTRLGGETGWQIFSLVVVSAPLFRLLQESPLLSKQEPAIFAALASFADMTPRFGEILGTSDGCSQRILEIAARQDPVSEKKILHDDLVRLTEAHRVRPSLLSHMETAARSDDWCRWMAKVESLVEQGQLKALSDSPLPAPFVKILANVRAAGPASLESNKAVCLLMARPRFSALLPEELLAFGQIRRQLPSPRKLLSRKIGQAPSDLEQDRLRAAWARSRLPKGLHQDAEAGLSLRLAAARYLFKLRTFAKLDAFSHRWPDLAQRLRVDRSALIALEKQVIEPQTLPPELEQWWETVRKDESLVIFLKLRPLFLHIDQDVLGRYFKVAEATEAQDPQPAQPLAITSPPAEETVPVYENVVIRFRPREDGQPESPLVIEIESPLGQARGVTPFAWPELLKRLNAMAASLAETTGSGLRDPAPRRIDLRDFLREAGEQLFTWLFQGEALAIVLRLLNEPSRYRIIWDMDKPGAMALPLECLYAPPPARSFLALTRRYSLIRHIPSAPSLFQPSFTPPLRILVMLPAPTDMTPLNTQGEMALFEHSFKAARESGLVQIHPLMAGKVTLENFQQALLEHRPHLLHFVGHGTIQEKNASLVIESPQRTARLLPAAELTDLLRDTPIRLAVLNACDTGSAPNNDAVTSVAGSLVAAGMPAVVGTTRMVTDQAALLFTRELYRSFTAGYSLEAAVVEARKALSVEGWDWSAYALFSGLTDLSSLRLALPNRRA